ncbi:MAG TPA: HAMP domain-containing sensor histidine kinase, partial [Propionibacteriaceae bacterium]|nr:HAMP domain-containing sensor histidine kinase [Propionibacteriaceae bacterium]
MSLRLRLVAGLLLLTAFGLIVTSVAGVVLLRVYLYDRAGQQAVGIPARGPLGSVDASLLCADQPAPGSALPSDFVLTLVTADGALACIRPTPQTDIASPDLTGITGPAIATHSGRSVTVGSTNGFGTEWRVHVTPLNSGDGYVVVAVSLADAQATLIQMRNIAAVAGVATLILVAVGAWFVVTIGLRPLSEIEDTAEDIAAGDLTRRVPPGKAGTEVGRLSAALNSMLAQIEQAFAARADSEARLRRFVADASHERRTPLTTIRGHAAMYELGAVSKPEDVARVLGRIESEAERMGLLVDDMLLLARLDQDRPLGRQPVDLLSLASDAVVDARAVDPTRPIDLVVLTQDQWLDEVPVVLGDEPQLRQVTANLLSNALRHTPPGTPVHVQVGVQGESVVLSVADEGPGMSPDVAARVFERFYRSDPGRTRARGGSGLGLSIVEAVVRAHGGLVTCQSSPTGTTFLVTLPVATPTKDLGVSAGGVSSVRMPGTAEDGVDTPSPA